MAGGGKRKTPLVVLSSDSDEEKRSKRPKAAKTAQATKKGGLTFSLSQEDRRQTQLPFSKLDKPSGAQGKAQSLWPERPPSPPRILQRPDGTLWVEKHVPRTEEDLVVHKKKLQAVKKFLESAEGASRLMLLSGPSGCGKTCLVRLLAGSLGFDVCEWRPPVHTTWTEHMYQEDRGQRYRSPLDEFDNFVAHAKLGSLSLTSSVPWASQLLSDKQGPALKGKLILVDDLPHAANAEHRGRLAEAIGELAETSRCPVAVLQAEQTSSTNRTASPGFSHTLPSELAGVLQEIGCVHISMNPVTVPNIVKALSRIVDAEGLTTAPDMVHSIAEAAQGDLFNAIETLQLVGAGKSNPALLRAARTKKGKGKARGRGKAEEGGSPKKPTACRNPALARDVNLAMFHALGKFLYNKREAEEGAEVDDAVMAPGAGAFHRLLNAGPMLEAPPPLPVNPAHDRAPMTFSPEAVMLQSGLEGASVAAFLHENYPLFINDDATFDAAFTANYFSQADQLLGRSRGGGGLSQQIDVDDWSGGATLAEAAGAMVAVRGLMFANAHPAAKRWLPLKGPLWFAVVRGIAANLACLEQSAWGGSSIPSMRGSTRELATGVLPYLRAMASLDPASPAAKALPQRWTRLWDGQLVIDRLKGEARGAPQQVELVNEDIVSDAIED